MDLQKLTKPKLADILNQKELNEQDVSKAEAFEFGKCYIIALFAEYLNISLAYEDVDENIARRLKEMKEFIKQRSKK